MQSNTHEAADKQPNTPYPNVISVRGDSCVGPMEISAFTHEERKQDSDSVANTPKTDGAEAQAKFDLLVVKCCEINHGQGYFHGRTTELVTAIKPAYSLFLHVLMHPEHENQLRAHGLLKERIRQLSKGKLALLCLYYTMNPTTREQKKSCSDYTAWLFQAAYEKVSPEAFATWAEKITLKTCLCLVRGRRAEAALDQPDATDSLALRLSIRRSAKGVHGTLNGEQFSVSEETLRTIIKMIEAEQPAAVDATIGADMALRSSFMEVGHAQ